MYGIGVAHDAFTDGEEAYTETDFRPVAVPLPPGGFTPPDAVAVGPDGRPGRYVSKLDLTDAEERFSATYNDDKVSRAVANGDNETARLRIMLAYAKTGAKDARSIDDIKTMAWQLRRNRDIATAKRAAQDLAKYGDNVSWKELYVPTTVDHIKRSGHVDLDPDRQRLVETGYRDPITAREAILNEANAVSSAAMRRGDAATTRKVALQMAYMGRRFGYARSTDLYYANDEYSTPRRFYNGLYELTKRKWVEPREPEDPISLEYKDRARIARNRERWYYAPWASYMKPEAEWNARMADFNKRYRKTR